MGSEGEITKYSIVFHRMNYSNLTPILQMFHWPAQTVHLTRKMEAHYCIMVHNKRSSTQYRTNSIRKLRLPHNRLFYPFVASRWYLSIFVFLFICPLYPHFLANRHTTCTSSFPPSFYCRRLCYRNLRFAAYSLFRFSHHPSGGPLTLFHPPFYQDHPESYHNG